MRRDGELARIDGGKRTEQLLDGRPGGESLEGGGIDGEGLVACVEDGGGGAAVGERAEEEARPEGGFDAGRGADAADA